MEETMPPETEFGSGYEPVRVRQFTIFLENKVGRLGLLVNCFEEQEARIAALSIEESGDAALVRIICSNPDLGQQILKENGFAYGETDVLAVEFPRRTQQPLIAICAALLSAEINIHYAYPLLVRGEHGRPTLALYVDEPTLAAQIMIRKGFNLIGESDLREE